MQILTQRGGYITVHSVLSNTYYGESYDKK